MSENTHWLLPEGIEEMPPVQAERLERMRRSLLDQFHGWGYQLVLTPFIEYVESLLVGTGNEMDLQTFKIVDQISGRMLGIRADMTPQVARIDACRLKQDVPTRLCYMGTVLHTRAQDFAGNRSPLQMGAELYGHAGAESDVEIMALTVATLECAGIKNVHLDLGHVGIYRTLMRELGLNQEQESEFFEALQRKDIPSIDQFLTDHKITGAQHDMLVALPLLNGDRSVLTRAREVLAAAGADVSSAIDNLEKIADLAEKRLPNIALNFDIAELRGYQYQTGVVFAAYVPGYGQEVARGGRYDEIGAAFGRARPATGFSTDLKTLLQLGSQADVGVLGVLAPYLNDDHSLLSKIAELRNAGERVVELLPDQVSDPRAQDCDRQLVKQGDDWSLVSI